MATEAGKATVPFAGDFSELTAGAAEAAANIGNKILGGGITKGLAVAAAAAIGTGVLIVDLGAKYQKTTNLIQANANISASAATAIGKAFLSTGGQVEFTANQMGQAFAGVAAQLALIQGRPLTAAQSLLFMRSAMALASATGESLEATTKTLATVMQVYGLNVAQAAGASDVLYAASKVVGQPIESIAAAVDKLHGKLGQATPPLKDTAGLMVDLARNGVPARLAVTGMSTAIITLIDPSKSAAKEIANLHLKTLDSHGSFVGMDSIITQLQPKFAKLTQAQQLQTATLLFGKPVAEAMIGVIKAGAPAYDALTKSIGASGSVQKAADIATSGFTDSWKRLTVGVTDSLTAIGIKWMPALTTAMDWVSAHALPAIQSFASWMGDHAVTALQTFATWISGTVMPNLKDFAGFFEVHILPTLQQFAGWVTGTVVPALQQFSGWITGTVVPALTQFADWIGPKVGPALQQFGQWVTSTAIPALEQFAGWITQNIVPALSGFATTVFHVGDWIVVHLVPPLIDLVRTVMPPLVSVVGFLGDHLWIVEGAAAAFLARLVLIKGIDLFLWAKGAVLAIQGMIDALTAFASEEGVVQTALTLAGGDGLVGAVEKLGASAAVTTAATTAANGQLDLFGSIANGAAAKVGDLGVKAVGATKGVGGAAAAAAAAGSEAEKLGPKLATTGGAFAALTSFINPVTIGLLAVGGAVAALVIAQPWKSLHDHFVEDLQKPGTDAYNQLHSDNLNAITDLENYAGAKGWNDIVSTARTTYQEVFNAHVKMVMDMEANSSEYAIFELSQIGTLTATQMQALRDYGMAYSLATGTQREQAAQLAQDFTADQIRQQIAAGLVPPAIGAIALALQSVPGALATQQRAWDTWSVLTGRDIATVQGDIDRAKGELNAFNGIVQNADTLVHNYGSYLSSPALQKGLQDFANAVKNLPSMPKLPSAPAPKPSLPAGNAPSSWIPPYSMGGVADMPASGGLAMLHGYEYIVPRDKASPELQAAMMAAISGRQAPAQPSPSMAVVASATKPAADSNKVPVFITQHFEFHGTSEEMLAQVDARIGANNAQILAAMEGA